MSSPHELVSGALLFLLVAAGCNNDRAAPGSSPAPRAAVDTRRTPAVADAIRQLGDAQQAVRDTAALALRETLASNPAASGDPGEDAWKKKLAALEAGITMAQLKTITGASDEGAASSGQTITASFRLDDYWTVEAYFHQPDSLRKIGPLVRRPRAVWVEPPKDFTGKWVAYFVNGVVANDIEYLRGQPVRSTSYHDNGQLASEQKYVDGKSDGVEVGYHRDGKKAYESTHIAGKKVGRSVHWFANGKLETEQTYADGELDGAVIHWREDGTKSSRIDYRKGKETGQAAWDEQGKLLYARGSAENAGAKPSGQ